MNLQESGHKRKLIKKIMEKKEGIIRKNSLRSTAGAGLAMDRVIKLQQTFVGNTIFQVDET